MYTSIHKWIYVTTSVSILCGWVSLNKLNHCSLLLLTDSYIIHGKKLITPSCFMY